MGASDYMVGNAPGGVSYAAPLVGFQIGQALGNLPEDYFNAQQRRRQTELQKPVIDPKTGQPTTDIDIITAEANRRGGLDYAKELLPFLQKQQILNSPEIGRAFGDMSPSGAPQQQQISRPSGPAAGPGNLTPNPPRQPPPTMAPGTYAQEGQDSVQSLATEAFGGRDVSGMIRSVASSLRVDPAAPLNPQQLAQAKSIMSRAAQGQGQQQQAPQQQGAQQNGIQAAPIPSGGASGAPAPAPGGQPENAAPASGIMPNAPPQTAGASPASALVPPGVDPLRYAQQLRDEANITRKIGARYNLAGFQIKALEDRAAAKDAQAKIIEEAIGKGAELTPEQKNLTSGTTVRAHELKNEVEQSQKTYNGIQAAATQFDRDMKPYLDISRSVLNDPSMYTGIAAERVLDFNKIKAAFGSPKAAMLQEALQKVTASSVLGQINLQRDQLQEAGGTSARIFAEQVGLVTKAAPAISTTLGGNRFLVEVASRTGSVSAQVGAMARDYIIAHGHLDPKFDKQLSEWMKTHPVFTQQEMSRPELIGSPTIPPELITNPQKMSEWARAMGLQPGDAIRAPDGSYKFYHGQAPSAPQRTTL